MELLVTLWLWLALWSAGWGWVLIPAAMLLAVTAVAGFVVAAGARAGMVVVDRTRR